MPLFDEKQGVLPPWDHVNKDSRERTRLCFDWDFGQQNQSCKGAKAFLVECNYD